MSSKKAREIKEAITAADELIASINKGYKKLQIALKKLKEGQTKEEE